ncbi:MAG: POTRA domain-containing protein [Bryobacteraceae bacterium]|jgi:outer membrane protein insertion porin family
MRWFLVFLMLAAASGFAQTRPSRPAPKKAPAKAAPAAPANQWPIATFTVEGAPDYTNEQILAASGLKIGQMAGKTEIEAAHDRLLATGAFDTVGYKFEPGPDGKAYIATFQVTEAGPVLPVSFVELGVPDSDLEKLFQARDPLFIPSKLAASKPALDRYTKWIEEYLASQGIESKIGFDVTPWPEQLAVVFRLAKGLSAVAEVTFEGNQAVPQNDLREAISGAAIGSLYTEVWFRQILDDTIRPVYEARGRIRVAFPKIRTEPVTDVAGLHVFVTVDEGESYKLGKVGIAGPTPLPSAELMRTVDFQTGDIANFDHVRDGLERIRKTLRRSGYLDAKVTAGRNSHDAEKTVDVAIHVDAGPEYLMGALAIVGLDLEGDAEITRMWAIKKGQPFNPEYPAAFLDSVRDQGLFDNLGATKSEIKIDASAHTVAVTLTFSGAKPEAKPTRDRRP